MKIFSELVAPATAIKSATVVCAVTALTFGFAGTAHAVAPVDINYGDIAFINPETDLSTDDTDDIGADGEVGDEFEYLDVFPGVDAIVKVVSITNLEGSVDKIDEGQDETDLDFDDSPLWLEVNPPGVNDELADGGPGSVKVRISFFDAGSDFMVPVTLRNVGITLKDIDNRQFAKFFGATSFLLSSDPETNLLASANGADVTISEREGQSSDNDEEEHWVAIRYASASSITVVVGSREAGDAEFGLAFTLPDWTEDPNVVTLSDKETLAPTGAVDTASLWVALGAAIIGAGVMTGRTARRGQR